MSTTSWTTAALAALLIAGCGGGSSVGDGAAGADAAPNATAPDAVPAPGAAPEAAGGSAPVPTEAVAIGVATPDVAPVVGSPTAGSTAGPAASPDAGPAPPAASPLEGSFEVGLVGVDVRRRSTGERLAIDVDGVTGTPLEVSLR